LPKRDMNDLLKKRMNATQQVSEITVGDEAYETLFKGVPVPAVSRFCELPIDRLRPFFTADIGFHPYPPEKLKAFSQQLAEQGIYERVIVRPIPDSNDYEILAGHNRTRAWQMTGHDMIPAEVVSADDARAVSIAVATNLLRRQDLTIIERGKAYHALLVESNRNGQRNAVCPTFGDSRQRLAETDDGGTSGEDRQKYNARKLVADFFGVTEYEIRKAIKLAGLIGPLAEILESTPRKLPIACAELIADYDATTQQAFVEMCSIEGYTLNKATPVRPLLWENRRFTLYGGRLAPRKPSAVLYLQRRLALIAGSSLRTLKSWAATRNLKSCFWRSCGSRSADV